uniref:ubiquitinyl hydrolase 1 n=4 Tax=Catarrhini TaxID=9526 RepID=A0A5F7ZW30_MACMU
MSETSFNLISEKCDILSILRDHPENRIYRRKIEELSKRFTAIRKTKGDGNCFYRALGYSYLESLLGKSREIFKFKERVLQTPNDLLAAGFEEHKFRNFFNAFYSVVELVEKDGSVSSLLKVFNDQSASDHIVQFLRLLTSAFIRNRADFFRHFIDEEMDIKDFCTHVGVGVSAPAPGSAPVALSHRLQHPSLAKALGCHDCPCNSNRARSASCRQVSPELPELCGLKQGTSLPGDFPSEK